METRYPDNILNEMILKNGLSNRLVDLNEGFDDISIYKLIYMLEKIVIQDDSLDIPMKERKPITIRISSYGGYCYDLWSAVSVINSLINRGYEINTLCFGKAMSCGFILFCSGVNRSMYEYSTLMYHSVSAGTYGKIADMQNDLFESIRLNDMAKEYVVSKTNITMEQLTEMDKCKTDWYIGSKEALELNIATKII